MGIGHRAIAKCEHCGMSDYGCRGDDCPGECHTSDECYYRDEVDNEDERE